MINTIEAVVKNGLFIPIKDISLPDGTKAMVTIMAEDDTEFWMAASQESLDAIWDNTDDDVYAELLNK